MCHCWDQPTYRTFPLSSAKELFYAWNVFQMTSKNETLSKQHLRLVQNELAVLERSRGENVRFMHHWSTAITTSVCWSLCVCVCVGSNDLFIDDYCLVKHLEGVCFKALKRWEDAEASFLEVIEKYDDIIAGIV